MSAAVSGQRLDDAWKTAFADLSPATIDHDFAQYLARRQLVVQKKPFLRPKAPVLAHRDLADAEVHLLWARLLPWERGMEAVVMREIDEALRVAPSSPEAHFLRGTLQLRTQDLQGAAKDLDEAVRLAPRDPRFRLGAYLLQVHRGQALKQAGWKGSDEAQAVAAVKDAAHQLQPVATSAWEFATLSQYERTYGELEAARGYAVRAVELSPIEPRVLDEYASVLAAGGDYPHATTVQERAVSFLPDDEANPGMLARLVQYRAMARQSAVR